MIHTNNEVFFHLPLPLPSFNDLAHNSRLPALTLIVISSFSLFFLTLSVSRIRSYTVHVLF